MEKIEKFKLWYSCKKAGKMQEYRDYLAMVEEKQTDISRFLKYLSDATERFGNIQKRFSRDSKEYAESKFEIYRWKQALDEAKLALNFIRVNSQEDIDYRDEQCKSFADKLRAVLSDNLDLRFHGTPIYFAEQIIKSGSITSTADRYDGYIKSTDMKGEISASDKQTIGRTINFFSDVTAYQKCLPCGCIFAIFPKDEEDAKYGQSLLHSVDFKKNPQQLFGIFTTPENIEQVKKWMKESHFNPNLVYTFEEFIKTTKAKSEMVDMQKKYSTRAQAPASNGTQNNISQNIEIEQEDGR